jgi:4-hydroxy-tetrahydrodipicolinate reductase
MIQIALVGYGKMGRLIEQLAPLRGCAVALRLSGTDNRDGAAITADALAGVDVAVDFSAPQAVAGNVERLAALKVPMVVGTTGWRDDLPRVRRIVEASGVGFVHGANFSVGVQVFYRLAEAAGRLLADETAYDAWLYEIHHKMKKDAPSGTLLEIRRILEAAGFRRPIDVASNRAGAVPGSHQIGFDSEADTITLEHRARSRAGFAHGALRAARWIASRQGFYEFSQIWEDVIRG